MIAVIFEYNWILLDNFFRFRIQTYLGKRKQIWWFTISIKIFYLYAQSKYWHWFKSTNDVYLCVPAVDWVLQQGQLVVPSSPVALVRSGLSHMADVTTRAHFSVALVNGLSANLTDASRQIFVKQVSRDNVCAVPHMFHMICLKNSIQIVLKYYLIIKKLLYFLFIYNNKLNTSIKRISVSLIIFLTFYNDKYSELQ